MTKYYFFEKIDLTYKITPHLEKIFEYYKIEENLGYHLISKLLVNIKYCDKIHELSNYCEIDREILNVHSKVKSRIEEIIEIKNKKNQEALINVIISNLGIELSFLTRHQKMLFEQFS